MAINGLAGVTWPWTNGIPRFEYDFDVIDSAIKDVILTVLGERLMNSRHGSEVIRLVFENAGSVMLAMAKREIGLALRDCLPIVKLSKIDIENIGSDTDPVDIVVTYEYQGISSSTTVPVPTEEIE